MTPSVSSICAACGQPAQGNYAIHRDGFDEGPEVPLCDGCGARPSPTCEDLWTAIAVRRQAHHSRMNLIYFVAQTGVITEAPPSVSNFYVYCLDAKHRSKVEKAASAAALGSGGLTYPKPFLTWLETHDIRAPRRR